jgi:hypothetical protein
VNRNIRVIGCVVLGLICIALRPSAQQKSDACETIRSILADASAVNPGMSRADLEKEFRPTSFTFRNAATYISRKCSYVAVDVEFDTTASHEGPPEPDDKITKISRPYLAIPSMD